MTPALATVERLKELEHDARVYYETNQVAHPGLQREYSRLWNSVAKEVLEVVGITLENHGGSNCGCRLCSALDALNTKAESNPPLPE